MRCVFIQQATNHFLVRNLVLFSLFFEKVNTFFTKSDSYFYCFISKRQLVRTWQKISDNLDIFNGSIFIFDFVLHRSFYLCASTLRQKSVFFYFDT